MLKKILKHTELDISATEISEMSGRSSVSFSGVEVQRANVS